MVCESFLLLLKQEKKYQPAQEPDTRNKRPGTTNKPFFEDGLLSLVSLLFHTGIFVKNSSIFLSEFFNSNYVRIRKRRLYM